MALHLHATKAASASKTDPRNNPAVYLQLQHVRLVCHRGAAPAAVNSRRQEGLNEDDNRQKSKARGRKSLNRTMHWTMRQDGTLLNKYDEHEGAGGGIAKGDVLEGCCKTHIVKIRQTKTYSPWQAGRGRGGTGLGGGGGGGERLLILLCACNKKETELNK